MSGLYLDLRDQAAVTDFMAENLEFARGSERALAEKIVKSYQEGAAVQIEKLADAARRLAMAAYPARYALTRFFGEEGAQEEWHRVAAAVRPSTANLLKRFRETHETESLDDTLSHAESDVALRDEERIEIEEVRKQARQDYWREKSKTLELLAKDGEAHLQGCLHRFGKLRDLALSVPRHIQDEIFSKLQHYEDRLLYEGEVLPVEILDKEIDYYVDQKEISPMES